MATHHSPPRAPPSDAYYTSYNSYGPKPSPSSSSPGAPPSRLSSHPFFVDQTPYLATSRRLSSLSIQSTSSVSTARTYRSASDSSSSSVASSASASTVSLAPSWPFRSSGRQQALAPAAPISPPSDRRVRHSRAASTGHASTTSPNNFSPKSQSLHTATAPIDRRCLQWMREAEQQEWILGSVASRSSPRGVRREALADLLDEAPAAGSVEVLYEHEREYAHQSPQTGVSTASKCSAVKRRFRLNSA